MMIVQKLSNSKNKKKEKSTKNFPREKSLLMY